MFCLRIVDANFFVLACPSPRQTGHNIESYENSIFEFGSFKLDVILA